MSKRGALLGDDFFRMRPMPAGKWYVAADRRREKSPHGRPGRAMIEMIFGAQKDDWRAPVKAAPIPRGKVIAIPKDPPPKQNPTRVRKRVNNFPSHYLDLSPKVEERRFKPL